MWANFVSKNQLFYHFWGKIQLRNQFFGIKKLLFLGSKSQFFVCQLAQVMCAIHIFQSGAVGLSRGQLEDVCYKPNICSQSKCVSSFRPGIDEVGIDEVSIESGFAWKEANE